jgi:hypothetical protein
MFSPFSRLSYEQLVCHQYLGSILVCIILFGCDTNFKPLFAPSYAATHIHSYEIVLNKTIQIFYAMLCVFVLYKTKTPLHWPHRHFQKLVYIIIKENLFNFVAIFVLMSGVRCWGIFLHCQTHICLSFGLCFFRKK